MAVTCICVQGFSLPVQRRAVGPRVSVPEDVCLDTNTWGMATDNAKGWVEGAVGTYRAIQLSGQHGHKRD